MTLKQFFKPTSLRIRVTIAIVLIHLLLILLSVVFDNSGCVLGCLVDPEGKIKYPCGCNQGLPQQPFLFTLILAYPLSCLIVFMYERIKNKRVKNLVHFFFNYFMPFVILYMLSLFILEILETSDSLFYFAHGVFIFALLFYILVKILGKKK